MSLGILAIGYISSVSPTRLNVYKLNLRGWAGGLWPAIYIGEEKSKMKHVYLDMLNKDMQ